MGAATTLGITLEEFASLPGDDARHEISAGELITMPPPKSLHARIALAVLEAIQAYLHGKNSKAIPEAGFVLSSNPLTIRQPDISIIQKKRLQATSPDSYFQGAPELAIEIVSPSDDADDIELKVAQYLQYGAIQVWVLYPKTKHVHVFQTAGAIILDESQTLDGGPVLPGFSIPVADLFAI